jgi:hypothetical protein
MSHRYGDRDQFVRYSGIKNQRLSTRFTFLIPTNFCLKITTYDLHEEWVVATSGCPHLFSSTNGFIRKGRIDQRLTVPQVAAKLGVSRTTISKWENGTLLPLPCYHERVTDHLGFNPFRKNPNPTVE